MLKILKGEIICAIHLHFGIEGRLASMIEKIQTGRLRNEEVEVSIEGETNRFRIAKEYRFYEII